MSAAGAVARFSHEASPLFAVVTANGLIKVWDTASGMVVATRPADLANPACAIAWENTSANEGGRQGRLAVGTGSGTVAVFNVKSGVDTPLGQQHEGAVTALAWADGALFSGGDDRMVCQWDVESGKAVRTFEAADAEVGAISPGGDDGTPLFTAATAVTGWGPVGDAAGAGAADNATATFTGHAGGTGYLCADRVASHVVSAALEQPDDNLVYAWPRKARKGQGPVAFATPGAINYVDVAGDRTGPDGKWAVAAVCDGAVHLFVPPKRASRKPQSAVATLAFVPPKKKSKGKGSAARTEALRISAACFSSRRPETHIVTARGALVAPVFEEVPYADEDGTFAGTLALVRDPAADAQLGRAIEMARPGAAAAAAAPAAADATIITAGVKVTSGDSSDIGSASATSEVPFGEQVLQLGLSATGVAGGGKSGTAEDSTPTARSLAHMLAQALHSNDQSLLEECLSNTNEGIVRNTVSRLPPVLAVKFLTDIVGKLEARPNRGALLMVWIRAVLLVHASYLMTVPDLPKVLAGMYNLVDARLAVFPRLLKLSGRLDLLLSQVVLQSKETDGEEVDLHVPVTEFVDDDESDSDESEGSADEEMEKDWEAQLEEDEEESDGAMDEEAASYL